MSINRKDSGFRSQHFQSGFFGNIPGMALVCLACLATSLQAVPLRSFSSKSPVFYRYTNAEAVFYFTEKREEHFKLLKRRLELGLRQLQTGYRQPGLLHKPDFWFPASEAELRYVLLRYAGLSGQNLSDAMQSGVYRDKKNIVIFYPFSADQGEILRLVFQEYGRRLLANRRQSFPRAFVGWFELGMASYIAWYTQAQLEGIPQKELHANLIEHYGLYFDPAKALPLDSLESRLEWQAATQQHPLHVYGQSVLAYMYFCSLARPWAGIRIWNRIEKTQDFPYEFERVSGLTLYQFERKFKKEIDPQVRKWRAKKPKRQKKPRHFPVISQVFAQGSRHTKTFF